MEERVETENTTQTENVRVAEKKKKEKKPPKAKKVKKSKKKQDITVKANKKGRHIMPFLNFLRIVALPVYYVLKPFRYYGDRKVPDGPFVYVCNHQVMLDIAYPIATTWEGIHFVAKKSLSETPFVRLLLRWTKAMPVGSETHDVRALLNCFKCLKNGEKVAIFPEGQRNFTDEVMLPFKSGAAAMAIRTKTPIIPMAVYGKPRYFRCTHILIDPPFELTEYYDRKLTEEDYQEADEKIRQYLLGMLDRHRIFLEEQKQKKLEKKNARKNKRKKVVQDEPMQEEGLQN